ncbi:MAG: hypothetical protein WCP92_03935 [bacterium]
MIVNEKIEESKTEHEEEMLKKKYKNILLTNLAQEYRIKLDDPDGKEKKYNYDDIQTNNKVVTFDESIGKVEAFVMFFKRKKYLKNLLKTE